jgi:hypothetical protein
MLRAANGSLQGPSYCAPAKTYPHPTGCGTDDALSLNLGCGPKIPLRTRYSALKPFGLGLSRIPHSPTPAPSAEAAGGRLMAGGPLCGPHLFETLSRERLGAHQNALAARSATGAAIAPNVRNPRLERDPQRLPVVPSVTALPAAQPKRFPGGALDGHQTRSAEIWVIVQLLNN